MTRLVNTFRNQEVLLIALLAVIIAVVVLVNPNFLHVQTLFAVLRYSMVDALFAVGVMLVLVSGGIDVSFLAIGIFAAYTTVKVLPTSGGPMMAVAAFSLAIGIGAILGAINAAIVLGVRVSTLIATLASSAMFLGALALAIGSEKIPEMPSYLAMIADTSLIEAPGVGRGTVRLNVLFVAVVALVALVAWALRNTIIGRSVYALGGDEQAAFRAGVPVRRTRVLVFLLAGALAGCAGLMHVTLAGEADPITFVGRELDVLAAVVLGGALLTGGKGTIRGTLLGVLTIAVIKQSLIPLGIPPTWEKAVVGALLLLGIALQGFAISGRTQRPILEAATEGAQP